MIKVNIHDKNIIDLNTEAIVIPVLDKLKISKKNSSTIKQLYPSYDLFLKPTDFTGATGSSRVIPIERNNKVQYLIFIGIGSDKVSNDEQLENYRRAIGSTVRCLERLKAINVAIDFSDFKIANLSYEELAKETVLMFGMASYQFNKFLTNKKRHVSDKYELNITANKKDHKEIKKGSTLGEVIYSATNRARYWCDSPSNTLTPTILAKDVEKIAKANKNLKCTIFNEKQTIKMGMGGLQAVSQGSVEESRFIIMEYKADKNAETLCLVGKGVTFDTGGISIKPSSGMHEMKDDMAGAAAVIATMEAIATLKPNINVIGITPVTENMPSGSAIKPGDVATHYNGVTSEILNTDAEGRLILADALSYAIKHYKPDTIIDAATLTGACSYALGPFFAGLMTQYKKLETKMMKAADASGDRLWPLPFHNDYKVAVKSTVADVSNIGKRNYRAGAITAGFFLSHFVDNKTPWVHLDIAGTSFNVPDRSYYRDGSTGFGVRLFIHLIMNWKK